MRFRLLLTSLAAAILGQVVFCQPSAAWWGAGHSFITASAAQHLPAPLGGFFAANSAFVSQQSAVEPPGKHYIDIDSYPEFFAGTFPRNLQDLIAIYGTTTVNANGRGPWTYADYVSSLSQAMATAATPADWQDLLPAAAAMAHYIEDLHQPLHLTRNYDGQYTGNSGIHARYEGQLISRHFADLVVQPAEAAYLASPIDFAFDGIDDHYGHVAEIMAADSLARQAGAIGSTAYYDALWNETGAFTEVLFQQASEAVASSWYTAWINAGSPRTFLSSSSDFEGDGDVDSSDLALWSSAFATSAQGDANNDHDSDGADLLLWQQQFGVATITPSASVPEPGIPPALTALFVVRARTSRSSRRTP